jgi:A/G-specific adenine glycosylase
MSRRSVATHGTSREWRTPQCVAATCEFYRAVQEDVIAWWREHHRTDLPWRPSVRTGEVRAASQTDTGTSSSTVERTPLYHPYEVWVSEVMSQQTRMETVIPYFKRWMNRFPTIEALADSSENEVKAAWAGMGYYRRALYLQKGAQYVLEWRQKQRKGSSTSSPVTCMPSTQQELLKVPGIGPYTSAAVASLCFGEAVCSVDGNVIRVLSRLRGERDFDPKVPANVKRACEWGQEVMGNTPHTASVICRDPSALNQGLMELGASVCRPSGAPLCASCPLQAHCCAYALLQSGEIGAIEGVIPVRAAVAAKRSAREMCVVHEVEESGEAGAPAETHLRRFVVVRRPTTGLLAGMLEFPTIGVTNQEGEPDGEAARLTHPLCTLPLLRESKIKALSTKACGSVRHIFSHIDMDVEVLHVMWPAQVSTKELLNAVACAIDEHHVNDDDNPLPAAPRVSLMTEAELKSGASSRLMLKILHQVSPAAVKRTRTPSSENGASSSTALTSHSRRQNKKVELENDTRR